MQAQRKKKARNVHLDGTKKENFPALADLIIAENIGMTIIGPENPLADGVVDYLASKGITRVIGPTQAASVLEADKFYSYKLMKELGIPQAESIECWSLVDARHAINQKTTNDGIVIKARGLAAG